MTGATSLTLTGLAISLAVLWANFRPWWKGTREFKQLIPFGQGFLLGAVSTVCTGGILGWLAGCSAGAANSGGERGVQAMTGSASSGALTKGSLGNLSPEGAVIVFLLTIGVGIAWKAAGKAEKKRTTGGAFVGATLCITAGVASLLNWLPGTLNQLGEQLVTAIQGAGIL
ncbi:hypothetical protein [Streptomyces sp. NE06-03C]|uniref:hypothetical protein n=1 Tax=Streptomyces sp. NE06-03C TaxID=3028694 RepID=UPI0029AA8DE3|nr:hypothetical protein [Streptomyces sp. NE06-03C]MDX2922079.1 hypothetical protein [Streptomyces sp. NE06-03C]